MEKPIHLLLNSDGDMLFHARDIWEEKGKKPIWIYYDKTSLSDTNLERINKIIEESEPHSFICLIRLNENEENPHGHIYFKFTIDKIQRETPNPDDGVPIIDYPRKNPKDKIFFYLRLIDAIDYETKYTDYATEKNREITNYYLRMPLLVIKRDKTPFEIQIEHQKFIREIKSGIKSFYETIYNADANEFKLNEIERKRINELYNNAQLIIEKNIPHQDIEKEVNIIEQQMGKIALHRN
ncbi:MAG: hypothetical protein PHH54_02565 [Candidatus Nanoarchaeia archaeon]|nr:hypothetical protein [Candidatus Nanoarchaeia archaeon]MDD5740844.1 hypothetical protein [Candidatus Nanoarchaeia archaeon]